MPGHVPVLLQEVLTHLQLQPGDPVIDATLGGGGHTAAILEATAPDGLVLGLEADPRTLEMTRQELPTKRLITVQGNFRHLHDYATANHFPPAAAVLLDLGLSSFSLADPTRGFSFQTLGPLDMRFDPAQAVTAAEIVNQWSVTDLVRIFRDYGDEPLAPRIAQHLIDRRQRQPFATTLDLATAITEVKHRRGARHPATQVFQALRMAVNDELGALSEVLPQALDGLRPNGRLAVMTFHSGEDRLVKRWGQTAAKNSQLTIITKHVIKPAYAEQQTNPRARSAKLRIYQKIT